jgi:hypothetical protein
MMATTRIRKRQPPAPTPSALTLNCGGTFDSQTAGWSLQIANTSCCCAGVAVADGGSGSGREVVPREEEGNQYQE